MKGSPCPNCGGKVIDFWSFFRTADMKNRTTCVSCGTVLTRSWMRFLPVVLLALGIGYTAGYPVNRLDWPRSAWIPWLLVTLVGGWTLSKLVDYHLPVWRKAEQVETPRRG